MGARASAWAASVLVAAAGGGVALAQAPPPPTTFPKALAGEPFLEWLRRETDITPGQVVAISPSAVTAVVSTFPGGNGPGPRLVIRAEAVDSAVVVRDGALSWHVSLNADCRGRRVQLGETTGYPERNLLGERRTLRPPEPDWRSPEPGTPLENAWRAACDPGFRRPLEARAETAQGPIPTAPPDAPQYRATAARPVEASSRPGPEAPKPPPTSTRGSAVSVQVLAAPNPEAARAALARLGAALEGRGTRIEQAQVQGRTWHRAIVTGFADRGDAARFCEALKVAGQACFVRPGG